MHSIVDFIVYLFRFDPPKNAGHELRRRLKTRFLSSVIFIGFGFALYHAYSSISDDNLRAWGLWQFAYLIPVAILFQYIAWIRKRQIEVYLRAAIENATQGASGSTKLRYLYDALVVLMHGALGPKFYRRVQECRNNVPREQRTAICLKPFSRAKQDEHGHVVDAIACALSRLEWRIERGDQGTNSDLGLDQFYFGPEFGLAEKIFECTHPIVAVTPPLTMAWCFLIATGFGFVLAELFWLLLLIVAALAGFRSFVIWLLR